LRDNLPWQEQERKLDEPVDEDEDEYEDEEEESGGNSSGSDPVSYVPRNRVLSAPWVHGEKPSKGFQRHGEDNVSSNALQEPMNLGSEIDFDGKCERVVEIDETPTGLSWNKAKLPVEGVKRDSFSLKSSIVDQVLDGFGGSSGEESDPRRLPWGWKKENNLGPASGDRLTKRNTVLAEGLIPEPELKRLRIVALRMVDRVKVGPAGVTQALVDSIHEKWKKNEVVKLKFEGPPALNMKRIHEILEVSVCALFS